MASAISKVITEYHELVNERNELVYKNRKLREALSMANSIILSGERHSDESEGIIKQALS